MSACVQIQVCVACDLSYVLPLKKVKGFCAYEENTLQYTENLNKFLFNFMVK